MFRPRGSSKSEGWFCTCLYCKRREMLKLVQWYPRWLESSYAKATSSTAQSPAPQTLVQQPSMGIKPDRN